MNLRLCLPLNTPLLSFNNNPAFAVFNLTENKEFNKSELRYLVKGNFNSNKNILMAF